MALHTTAFVVAVVLAFKGLAGFPRKSSVAFAKSHVVVRLDAQALSIAILITVLLSTI